ncbi:MAG: hypothetical protein SVU32_06780 [Candidatus Nanohaloarchaea archaeon]|nr:hypothetical protein [Candidatus Nanohaloarchaea archaeon]
MDRIVETTDAIADSAQEALESRMDEMNKVLYQFDDLQRNLKRMSMTVDTWEDFSKDLVRDKDKIVNELVEDIDQDEYDLAEGQIRKAVNLVLDRSDDIVELAQARAAEQQVQQPAAQQTQQQESSDQPPEEGFE